jgi:hypothetical protein
LLSPDDKEELNIGFEKLSTKSKYRRFFVPNCKHTSIGDSWDLSDRLGLRSENPISCSLASGTQIADACLDA